MEAETGSIELHNATETAKHLTMKALIGLHIQQGSRPWGTAIRIGDRGVVDVLDWGPPNGKAVACEIETGCTPKREQKKVAQYSNWTVRDVLVLDPLEAPEDLPELHRWVGTRVVG